MTSRGLFRLAVFVTAYALIHIELGALVTSSGSGMAFEDWPLWGDPLWPARMDTSEHIGHVHRVSGMLLGVFALALAWLVHRVDGRVWLVRSSTAFVVLVAVQGVFGAVCAVYGDSENGVTWAPAAILHGALAQPTLCAAAFLAFALSPAWRERVRVPARLAKSARSFAATAFVLVFAQITTGAVVRHTNATGMLWLHVFSAVVVAIAILISTSYNSGKFGAASPGIRRLGLWTWILLMTQLVLGFATLLVRKPKDPSNVGDLAHTTIASTHVVVGAGLFVVVTLLLARTWRTLQAIPAPCDATAATVA